MKWTCVPRFVLWCCFVFWVSSCSLSPIKIEPQKTYVINTLPKVPVTPSAHPFTLLITQPEADRIYNTTQMAYTQRPFEISYFSKHFWAETPTQMLYPLIVQSLQNTHHFRVILSSSYPGHYHFVLHTQLLQLQQDFLRHPAVLHLVLRAQLIDQNARIVTKEFSINEVMTQNTPYSGVIAANAAVARFLKQLTQFCVQNSQ